MQPQAPLTDPPLPSRWPIKAGVAAVAHLANDTATSMVPALLPFFGVRLGLTPGELALLASLFAIASSLPQPFFGALADRVGSHRIGTAGLAVSGAIVGTLGLVSSVPQLCAVLVLGGLGSSALHPAGIGLARASSTANPGLAVALFTAAGMAGGGLGPLLTVGGMSSPRFGELAIVATLVMLTAGLFARLAAPNGSMLPTRPSSPSAVRFIQGPTAWLAVVAVAANLAILTFVSAVPLWLVQEKGIPTTSPVIGTTLATFSLATAGGAILGGFLVKRLPRTHLIVGSLSLSVAALEGVLVTAPGSAQYFIAVAAAGALLFLHAPLLVVRAQELSPGAESAVAGILVGGTSTVAALLYAGLGEAQEAFGIGTSMAASFLFLLPAAHVAGVVLRSAETSRARASTACGASGCPRKHASLDCCAPGALACAV